MPVTGEAMAGFWGKKTKDQDTGVSADFQRALMQEVMTTELLRIKALIATAALLGVILVDRLLLRIRGGEPRLARQSEAGIPLFDHRAVHPVRTVGAWPDHPPHAAGPRPAGDPALSRRADRDLDADGRAGAAHQQHGIGGRARFRRADDLFHLHHPLDAAAGFLALHLHRRRRRRSIVLHGDVLSSGGRRPKPSRSTITPRAA